MSRSQLQNQTSRDPMNMSVHTCISWITHTSKLETLEPRPWTQQVPQAFADRQTDSCKEPTILQGPNNAMVT